MQTNHQSKSSITLVNLVETWVRTGKFKFDYFVIPPKDGYHAQLRPFTSRFKTTREFFCLIKDEHIDLLDRYVNDKPVFITFYASDPNFFEKFEDYLQSFKDCAD